mmetsp:Transcript_20430/g.23150  ORF Transcript_20430/g.23150 Transcript_20430/m.23150 type:complete len:83 (+) Transcript_20430:1745-1993(+)
MICSLGELAFWMPFSIQNKEAKIRKDRMARINLRGKEKEKKKVRTEREAGRNRTKKTLDLNFISSVLEKYYFLSPHSTSQQY